MHNLYITQYSIGFISPALLCFIISTAIILRQIKTRNFTPDRVSLSLYFFSASVYNTLNFFGFSIYSASAQKIWYMESFMPIGVLFIIRFAYYYPSSWHETERKIVLFIGSLLAAAAISEYWVNSWNSPVKLYGQTYGSEYHSSAIPLIIAVFYLWSAAVFIRRALYYEKKSGIKGNLFKTVTNPATQEANTARIFAGLILLDVVHSFIVYGVMNRIPVSSFIISLTTTIVVLVIYSLYTTVYLHSAYDNIPFIYKLTGIPLIVVLLIVTTSGYMMMYFRSISYDEMYRAIIPTIRADEKYIRNNGPFPVSYISIFKDPSWDVIYDKAGDIPDIIESGLWEEAPSGVQMKKGSGLKDLSNIEADKKYFMQIKKTNYNQYNRTIDDKIYGFGIPYIDYLKYMHKTGRLILIIMIVSIILIISLLPVLYYLGITGPLNKIINVSSGKGDTEDDIDNEFHHIEKIIKSVSGNKKSKPFPETPDDISPLLKKKLDSISDYLNNNFHDDISREGLASMINLDPDYISRLFKIYTGMKIGDYINKLRIEEAARLLVSTNRSVIDISMTAGFESLRTFNRAFFRIMGETPTSFRNKNQSTTGQKQ